jgi:hypothetical protein
VNLEAYYAAMADKMERDPIQDGATANRATVPMGRGFALWQRMNPGSQLVWVDDFEGRPRALTPKQALVISFARSMVDGHMLTMRAMAVELGVNVSTVSRALQRAQAWGLLVYIVGKGRFAGLVIVRYVRDGGFLDSQRKAARERVARWKKAAEARVSRLWVNVAPYILDRESEVPTSYRDSYYYSLSKGATLTAQLTWTPEELREAGII